MRIILTSFFIFLFASLDAQNPFVTTWKTDNPGGSAPNQITIPTAGSGYNYTVEWGDGNSDTGVTGSITHTYTSPGTYTVSVSGIFPRIFFNSSPDREKILSVESWGDIEWQSMYAAFWGCRNLMINAVNAPDLSKVSTTALMFASAKYLVGDLSNWDVSTVVDMSYMFIATDLFTSDLSNWDVSNVTNMASTFNNASSFTSDLSNWNVSSVTNMNFMFNSASSFNSDLSNWNVSNVTNMSGMFGSASSFNSDLSSWDVSNVTDMSAMFSAAILFNSNLANWNVSKVTDMRIMFDFADNFQSDLSSWDVSSVTKMTQMFRSTISFNSDLSNWNVSNVTDMQAMFLDATAFSSDLGQWDVSNVTVMTSMLNGSGLSMQDYDNTLIGWAQLPILRPNIAFGAGGLTYCLGVEARNQIIATYNWNITGDQISDPSCLEPPTYSVTWTDKFRTVESGNQIINTNTSSGWKSSAASTNRIPASTDGFMEFTVTHSNRNRMIGFSENNFLSGTWRDHWETIEYNLYLKSNGRLVIYESASSQGSAGSYSVGDVIRIERIGGNILYKVNDQTRFTSSCPFSKSLIVDFCLYTPNDYFPEITISEPAGSPSGSRTEGRVKNSQDISKILENAQPNLNDSTSNVLFSDLVLHPNPVRDKMKLSISQEQETEADILVFTTNANEVLLSRKWQLHPGRNQKSIDVESLLPGHYLIQVIIAGKEEVIKMIKL